MAKTAAHLLVERADRIHALEGAIKGAVEDFEKIDDQEGLTAAVEEVVDSLREVLEQKAQVRRSPLEQRVADLEHAMREAVRIADPLGNGPIEDHVALTLIRVGLEETLKAGGGR